MRGERGRDGWGGERMRGERGREREGVQGREKPISK